MTDAEFDGFRREFDRLVAGLVKFKMTPEERQLKADAYFHALKRFPLGLVIAKMDRWLESEAKWPAAAELAGLVVMQGVELEVLSPQATEEWLEAERRHWEAPACGCSECVAAGVADQPLRFVPEVTADDRDRHVQLGDRMVTAGHWIHGFDLKRLYRARAAFVDGGGKLPQSTETRDRHSQGLRALLETKTAQWGSEGDADGTGDRGTTRDGSGAVCGAVAVESGRAS